MIQRVEATNARQDEIIHRLEETVEKQNEEIAKMRVELGRIEGKETPETRCKF